MDLIGQLERENGKKNLPTVHIGDTVEVNYLIKEGDKERIQLFIGTVIARKHGGVHETFTVRRISFGEGVERVFPVHSPNIAKIEVIRVSEVMRSRLYYLRDRVGKSATKVKEAQRAEVEAPKASTPAA